MNRSGRNGRIEWLSLLLGAVGLAAAMLLHSAPISDIRNTKHNFSAASGNTVRATTNSEVCVFCHTPHGASTAVPRPLWNRSLSSATYTKYTSSSIDATELQEGENWEVGDSSKLCLSCHDGTLAIGTVTNAPGTGTGSAISMQGVDAGGQIPVGEGANTGFTRRLGVDLSNDHPISFTYNSALAADDGELRNPTAVDHIWTRGAASSDPFPLSPPAGITKTTSVPLEEGNQLECMSCHDPHVRDTSLGSISNKFLRLNRFQTNAAPGTSFNASNDIICLACHDKLGATWASSSHADPGIADEIYRNENVSVDSVSRNPSSLREFPANLPVWRAACLNCHDTHTVAGSRRLLREGTDATGHPKSGGDAAIEEVCYQCHTTVENAVIAKDSNVPNIEGEFARTRRMPITDADQPGSGELHDIYNADFIECQKKLGASSVSGPDSDPCSTLSNGTNNNRHVECTDCHNPHRVTRNSLFNNQGSNTARTHAVGGVNGNVASGALRGSWGVEPTMGAMNQTWPQLPSSYTVKKGDPGASTSTARSESYLTREYQLCFKCHSDYSLNSVAGSAGSLSNANMPSLGYSSGATPSGTNQLTKYTNVAAEFMSVDATDPPTTNTDQGEESNSGSACGGGDCNPTPSAPGGTNNHRSWHPVVFPTGRDPAERGSSSFNNIRHPFDDAVGTQTMHCSDCHGADGSWTQGGLRSSSTGGPNSNVQGPHGSSQNFLLKGSWDPTSNTPSSAGFCENCHDPNGSVSGFSCTSGCEADHGGQYKSNARCGYCHIALPHGWKNKAFLVNLRCVGPENGETSGFSAGCKIVSGADAGGYTAQPYYVGARLSVDTWRASGEWTELTSCGNNDGYGAGTAWMDNVCGSW